LDFLKLIIKRKDLKNMSPRREEQGRGGMGRGERGMSREAGGKGGFRAFKKRERKDDVLMRMRKKTCRFCEEKVDTLDYKDMKRLERLVSERGKILSRRITGICSKHQRKVEEAVKRARFIALLPFLKK
jgi:small subunit ribosomal protein S18